MSGDNYHVAYSFPIAGIFFQTYPILKKQVFANLFPLRAAVYLDTGIRTAGGRAADGTRGTDGGGKNLIARSPFCGKEGKFGSFIEGETARKKPFRAHCFSCGCSTTILERLLENLGRMNLLPTETASLPTPLANVLFTTEEMRVEVDDE